MLRLAFDFIITWRETRTRPNAYATSVFRVNNTCTIPTVDIKTFIIPYSYTESSLV